MEQKKIFVTVYRFTDTTPFEKPLSTEFEHILVYPSRNITKYTHN